MNVLKIVKSKITQRINNKKKLIIILDNLKTSF